MLSQLLKTLKSQKSSQSQQEIVKEESKKAQLNPNSDILKYRIEQPQVEEKNSLVEGKLRRIRYLVLVDLPDFSSQVLGCPISVFHILPHSQRKVKSIDLTKQSYPCYLQFLKPMMHQQLPTFNHLLINDYPPGIGIMPHSDGPAYLPKVLVLSLNGYAIINFQKSYSNGEEQGKFSSRILLQPNSIHIFEEEAYTQYLHGIQNYLIDSIFIKYDPYSRKVQRATVDNYSKLACRRLIEQQVASGATDSQLGDIRIVKLQNNQEFSHKIQITRKQRISITIRQKYSH